MECAELGAFVGSKANPQWIWLALDRHSRQIVGTAIGARDEATAQHLWDSLPAVYRQWAICYTDFWAAYQAVLPSKRQRAVDNASGQTNHIERFKNTLRQRIGRLVRKTLAFSKKRANPRGAIWLFLHHDNASPKRGQP